jgi:hypothetical protein
MTSNQQPTAREGKESKMKTEIKVTGGACYTWRLREHTHWSDLVTGYCESREEFQRLCDEAALKAGEGSDNSPSLFEVAEFLDCDYYENAWPQVKPDTKYVLTEGREIAEQFTDEVAANKAYHAAILEHGYERLTCDRGGHAGQTDVVDVEGISLSVWVGFERYRIEPKLDCYDAAEILAALTEEMDAEDDAEEIATLRDNAQVIADAVNAKLQEIEEE